MIGSAIRRVAVFTTVAALLLASVAVAPASAYNADSAEGTIYRLYRAYFVREPDAGGYQYWLDRYESGYPLTSISDDFTRSAEFQSDYGNVQRGDFVRLVYGNVLEREPDQAGYDYWVDQMTNHAMPRGVVMINFSDSAEFRSKTADGAPPGTTLDTSIEADVQRIKGLWRGYSDSWYAGTDRGFDYLAMHNYPGLGNSRQACEDAFFPNGTPEGYREEAIVDADTIEPDPGWRVPDGPIAGQPLEGRIYIFQLQSQSFADGYPPSQPYTEELHTTIFEDGSAKFFFWCY